MTGFCGHGDAPSASMKEQKQTTTSPSQELYQRSPNTGTLELKFPLGYPYRWLDCLALVQLFVQLSQRQVVIMLCKNYPARKIPNEFF
jgi:hypothetical protein